MNGTNRAFQTSNILQLPGNLYGIYQRCQWLRSSFTNSTIVYPQLTASAAVTKTLDCTSTPNATITTTITEVEHYLIITNSSSVIVVRNSITGPTFTYSPAVAGTYTIQITDANTCTTTTSNSSSYNKPNW
jgi:hypothetical protein